MAWTAAVGRSHFTHRAGVVFEDTASLRDGLRALADSSENPKPNAASKVAFAYTEGGGFRVGFGEELYESEPVARAVLNRCDEVIRVERGASLLDVMFGRSGELDDPAWAQSAVFAFECALTALWSSVGIRPNVVFGAGAGEVAAAYAAGVFTLEEGLRFAARRGALMEALSGAGGDETALDDLETALEGVVTALPSLTMVSQVTGRALGSGETMDGAYWRTSGARAFGVRGMPSRTHCGIGGGSHSRDWRGCGARPEGGLGLAGTSVRNGGKCKLRCAAGDGIHSKPMSRQVASDSSRRLLGLMRRGLRSSLQGCLPERRGDEFRCRAILSNESVSGFDES